MKLIYACIIVLGTLIFTPSGVSAQITNSGFETWTNGMPDGWYTYSASYNDVTQSTIAHTGASSLKGSIVLVKNAAVGSLLQAGSGSQGFPISERYTAVTGYYKFIPTGGDHFSVSVAVKAGTAPVGAGQIDESSSTASFWTKFTVPITYTSTAAPTTIQIQVGIFPKPGVSDPHVGSYYLLDDLSLVLPTGVNAAGSAVPSAFALGQNFPNPFNPTTRITFSLPVRSFVSLKIFDITGNEVAQLLSGELPAGKHTRQWDASRMPGGMYFYRLQAGTFTATKRLILLK